MHKKHNKIANLSITIEKIIINDIIGIVLGNFGLYEGR